MSRKGKATKAALRAMKSVKPPVAAKKAPAKKAKIDSGDDE